MFRLVFYNGNSDSKAPTEQKYDKSILLSKLASSTYEGAGALLLVIPLLLLIINRILFKFYQHS